MHVSSHNQNFCFLGISLVDIITQLPTNLPTHIGIILRIFRFCVNLRGLWEPEQEHLIELLQTSGSHKKEIKASCSQDFNPPSKSTGGWRCFTEEKMICSVTDTNAPQLCMFYGAPRFCDFSLHSNSTNPMPISFSLPRLGSLGRSR